MANLNDPEVRELLEEPNYAVVSTVNQDGSIHSTVIWANAENGHVAINSALGRHWPTNLQRDPNVTLLIYESGNPYNYVEIRGQATASTEDADAHIDALAKKYTGQAEYPYRRAGEQRVKFTIEPTRIRHIKQR